MAESTIRIILSASELAGDGFLLLGCAAVAVLLLSYLWGSRK